MISRELTVQNASGLHTRPGTRFVKEAKKFACDVRLRRADKECSAKSLLKVMQVGVSQGDVIALTCDGPDEAEAMEALTTLIAQLQG